MQKTFTYRELNLKYRYKFIVENIKTSIRYAKLYKLISQNEIRKPSSKKMEAPSCTELELIILCDPKNFLPLEKYPYLKDPTTVRLRPDIIEEENIYLVDAVVSIDHKRLSNWLSNSAIKDEDEKIWKALQASHTPKLSVMKNARKNLIIKGIEDPSELDQGVFEYFQEILPWEQRVSEEEQKKWK